MYIIIRVLGDTRMVQKMRVSAGVVEEEHLPQCFLFFETINNEDTLRGLVNGCSLDVLYQLARENCLSPGKGYTLFARLLQTGV